MNSYIKYGWDKNVINPHVGSNQQSVSASSSAAGLSPSVCLCQYDPPKDGWRPLRQAFTSEVPKFNNGHIVTYFVNRSVIDGFPSASQLALLQNISLGVNLYNTWKYPPPHYYYMFGVYACLQ